MGAAAEISLPQSIDPLFALPLRERLLRLRRELHANPELSSQEEETARRLGAALEDAVPERIDRVAGTGVVARLRGRDRRAPTVAIRGDIDALPIQEATDLPYASRRAGVMHACGHDVHATWAVGAAYLLAQAPAAGDVVIILQPAEETGTGALAILGSGALDGVSAIFGGHVDRRFEVGKVVADVGPLAASADTFEIVLRGAGAHAARPHEAADPVVGAGAVIMAMQTIVARRLNPASAGVVTVGSIHAGTAANVIPDRATLTGTIRAVEPAVRKTLHDELRRVVAGVASAHRLEVDIRLDLGTPPLVNADRPTVWAQQAVASVLGSAALVPLGFLNLAGEDFAHYLERLPGCFLRIGAREPGGPVVPAHAPHFYAAEESIFIGAAVLAETARVASAAIHDGEGT